MKIDINDLKNTLRLELEKKFPGREFDTVIFDLGGVLVKFHPELGMEKMGFDKTTISYFMENLFSGVWESFDKINCSEEYVRAEFKSILNAEKTKEKVVEKVAEKAVEDAGDRNYDKEVDYLWDHLHDITGVYEYSYDWVKALKESGMKCFVLSNFGSASFKKNSELYNFLELMDGGVVSYQIETMKPDPKIYEALIEKYHIDRRKAVFIDDRQINVDGAKAVGLEALLFEGCNEI